MDTAPPPTAVDPATVARLRLAVVRLSRQVRQRARTGVTPSQLSALATVDHHGPMRLADLAEHEGIARSTVTRLVRALEDADLLHRAPDPADGRCAVVSLTSRADDLLADARGRAQAFLADRVDVVGIDDAALAAAATVLEQLGGRP